MYSYYQLVKKINHSIIMAKTKAKKNQLYRIYVCVDLFRLMEEEQEEEEKEGVV